MEKKQKKKQGILIDEKLYPGTNLGQSHAHWSTPDCHMTFQEDNCRSEAEAKLTLNSKFQFATMYWYFMEEKIGPVLLS